MRGGRNYLIARAVARTLRSSVYNEVMRTIHRWGVQDLFVTNKTEMTITCANGYSAMLTGLEDVERVKSRVPAKGVLTDVVIEEATEVERNDIRQLQRRMRGQSDVVKRLTLLFNPIVQDHHIYLDYFAGIGWADDQRVYESDDLLILKTTHVDNRFLTQQDRDVLENETDPYWRDVYTLGNWGVLGNTIFRNYVVADTLDPESEYYLPVEQRTNRRPGLDFGFSDDPAASTATHYDKRRKRIYIYDELYERGLTNDLLAREMKRMHGADDIRADSAEPKSIAELRQYGLNVTPARKGKDSVLHGVQWLQQQQIVIDKRCVNTIREFQQYKWKEDKAGNALRVPVDKNNHAIDQLRYAYEDDMLESTVVVMDNFLYD